MNLKKEILRKIIHVLAGIYPLIYIYTDKLTTLKVISILFAIAYFWEFMRKTNNNFFLLSFFNKILRQNELKKHKMVGATWFLLSSFFVVLIFPKLIAIISLFILVFCDAIAAIVGKLFGKHKLLDKTYEGTSAFIISGMIIVYIISVSYNIHFSLAYAAVMFVVVFLAGLMELYSSRTSIDDNFSVTIVFAISYYIVATLWFPEVLAIV